MNTAEIFPKIDGSQAAMYLIIELYERHLSDSVAAYISHRIKSSGEYTELELKTYISGILTGETDPIIAGTRFDDVYEDYLKMLATPLKADLKSNADRANVLAFVLNVIKEHCL